MNFNYRDSQQHLVHWKCPLRYWKKFAKVQWRKFLIYQFAVIFALSYFLIAMLWAIFKQPYFLLDFKIFICLISLFGSILFCVYELKIEHHFYLNSQEAIDIYINYDKVSVNGREYKLGHWIVPERLKLKIGNPSILVFVVLRFKKGIRMQEILVPVPKGSEEEALKLIKLFRKR